MASTKVILHIEDDARVREAVAQVLGRAGYTVVGVPNGLDALEHLAIFGPPALVLVDVTMPVMDGRTFLAERRKWASLTHVPFVALTATDSLDAKELGLAEILRKPVDIDRLLAVARRYANGRSGTFAAVTPTAPGVSRKKER